MRKMSVPTSETCSEIFLSVQFAVAVVVVVVAIAVGGGGRRRRRSRR